MWGPKPMTESPGPLTKEFFEKCGYSAADIATFSDSTRLFQDIGLFGGNAYDEFKVLQREFNVDLSSFPIRKYFPNEIGREHFILTFFQTHGGPIKSSRSILLSLWR
jgi:hypothetical protein